MMTYREMQRAEDELTAINAKTRLSKRDRARCQKLADKLNAQPVMTAAQSSLRVLWLDAGADVAESYDRAMAGERPHTNYGPDEIAADALMAEIFGNEIIEYL